MKLKAILNKRCRIGKLVFAYRLLIPLLERFTSFAIPAMATMTFLAGILVPIYSDEIANQMTRSRFFSDGGRLVELLPQCHFSVLVGVPVTWYPAAILNAVLYFGLSGVGLRLLGITLGLAWLALLWFWAGRHSQDIVPRRSFQAFVISLNLLGVVPFVLVLARTEQLLVLALAAYCLFPLYWRVKPADSTFLKCVKATLFLILTSVFLFAHPKALLFFPVTLISAWLVFEGAGNYLRIIVLFFSGLTIIQTLEQAQKITQCPGAPLASDLLAKYTLDFHQYVTDRGAFFNNAWINLTSALSYMLKRVPTASHYQSSWLPPVDGNGDTLFGYFGGVVVTCLFLLVVALLCSLAYQVLRQLKSGSIKPSLMLGMMLAGGMIIHAIVYNKDSWNFYTPGLIIPAISMLFLLVLPDNLYAGPTLKKTVHGLLGFWRLLALSSMIMLLYSTVPPLLQNASSHGYVIANQPLSTRIFMGEREKDELHAFAAACGISKRSQRLVLDGTSYFEFQNNKQPINILYVSDYAFGMDVGENIIDFLKKINSDGVLSRCDYLPKNLRDDALVSGEMCCVQKSVWN